MEACGSAHFWARRIEELGPRVVLLPAAPGAALRPRQQDRPHGRQGDPGGEPQRGHPTRPGQDARAAGRSTSLHRLRQRVGGGAHGAPQHPPRAAARARRLHPRGRAEGDPAGVGASSRTRTPSMPDALRPFLAEACAGDPRHRAPDRAGRAPARGARRADAGGRSGCCTDPRHRAAHRHRARRLRRGHPALPLGAPPGQLPGAHAARVVERPHDDGWARISKRGDGYLRTLLIHGARSVLARAKQSTDAARPPAGVGGSGSRRRAATTRPRSRWPTSWRASSGRSGATTPTTSRAPHRRLDANDETTSHPGLPRDRVMVKQVGPAQGKPITMMAFEAAVNDWLPCARIPSWPGAHRAPTKEAGDTFAVRPAQHDSSIATRALDEQRLSPERCGLRPCVTNGAPQGGALGQGLRPCTPVKL